MLVFNKEFPSTELQDFPTPEMISALLKVYGTLCLPSDALVPISFSVEQLERTMSHELPVTENRVMSAPKSRTRKVPSRVEHQNTEYTTFLKSKQGREPFFLRLNTRVFPYLYQTEFTYKPKYEFTESQTVYNYSQQRQSSTAKQLTKLRDEIREKPDTYVMFGPKYLSQMVTSEDVDIVGIRSEKESRAKWRTPVGFNSGPFKK